MAENNKLEKQLNELKADVKALKESVGSFSTVGTGKLPLARQLEDLDKRVKKLEKK
jgi:predicted RNase H-like nuclease (RuvC/YqgF family)